MVVVRYWRFIQAELRSINCKVFGCSPPENWCDGDVSIIISPDLKVSEGGNVCNLNTTETHREKNKQPNKRKQIECVLLDDWVRKSRFALIFTRPIIYGHYLLRGMIAASMTSPPSVKNIKSNACKWVMFLFSIFIYFFFIFGFKNKNKRFKWQYFIWTHMHVFCSCFFFLFLSNKWNYFNNRNFILSFEKEKNMRRRSYFRFSFRKKIQLGFIAAFNDTSTSLQFENGKLFGKCTRNSSDNENDNN